MAKSRPLMQKCMAEFLGVFILCLIGNGSVAETLVKWDDSWRMHSSEKMYSGPGTWLGINICYGLAVTLGVYVSGRVSGGHINPAVSMAEAVRGTLAWKDLPFYIISQISGGFVASIILYLLYIDMPKDEITAGIFATYPRPGVSLLQAFLNEVVGTFLLVLCVRSITDSKNDKATAGMEPLMVGVTVFCIGASLGVNTGYALNPARDLGPRLFTSCFGWGSFPFQAGNENYNYHFWIPIIAPIIGAQLGAFMYKFGIEGALIDNHHSETKPKDPEEQMLTVG